MIRERILFRPFFSLLLLLSFSPFCTYEPTSQIHPREKTLKNGKPRVRRAKWLPEREVDLVYLYSDHYLDARNPTPAETDFFTITRLDAWGESTWFMCTPQAAEKLIAMDYDNLAVKETTIVG